MNHYQKTAIGLKALHERSPALNARQRRLLVLIGTSDYISLPHKMKQKIATPELLQQLEIMGLIELPQTMQNIQHNSQTQPIPQYEAQTTTPYKTLATAVEKQSLTKITEAQLNPILPSAQIPVLTPAVSLLQFDEIKQLMIHLLQQYCGLLAKQLILQIQATHSSNQLKHCQMQWLTILQESKIAPAHLNQCLQQINFSLKEN